MRVCVCAWVHLELEQGALPQESLVGDLTLGQRRTQREGPSTARRQHLSSDSRDYQGLWWQGLWWQGLWWQGLWWQGLWWQGLWWQELGARATPHRRHQLQNARVASSRV